MISGANTPHQQQAGAANASAANNSNSENGSSSGSHNSSLLSGMTTPMFIGAHASTPIMTPVSSGSFASRPAPAVATPLYFLPRTPFTPSVGGSSSSSRRLGHHQMHLDPDEQQLNLFGECLAIPPSIFSRFDSPADYAYVA